MVEYLAGFLMLERFVPSCFTSERERVAQIVSSLRISLCAVAATFSCLTLIEVVMKALECGTHDSAQTSGQV